MLYFIPAWYQGNKWIENEQSWRVRRMRTEFDDTVKQIQLFHRSGVCPYQIMLLSFTPNFRHFLHRQGVYHAPYWSCFDAIQCIRRKKAMVLSFHNLSWPKDIEFVYSAFVMVAMLKGKKYAQIEFGEDGNPIRIDIYKDGRISRCNIYDDRGFVSSSILYEKEKAVYQEYFTENGSWKLRCYEEDGHIEINPRHPEYLLIYQGAEQEEIFSRLEYDNIDQVIQEVCTAYLKLTSEEDIFCVAMHNRHAALLEQVLEKRKTILSFFADRYSVCKHPEMIGMIEGAGCVVTDSRESLLRIQRESAGLIKRIIDISPYDSRMDIGISQQLNVQKILVPIDGLKDEVFMKLIQHLGKYLLVHKEVRIHLFTREAAWNKRQLLLDKTRRCLKAAGLEEEWALEKEEGVAENDLDAEGSIPIKFYVEQCVDELTVTRCMREQRLIVDLRAASEIYLQITAISIGIPQIVSRGTEFVESGKNGIVLKKMSDLHGALDYYLAGLANWNNAKISAYELGKKYRTDKLIEKWKEVIDFVG